MNWTIASVVVAVLAAVSAALSARAALRSARHAREAHADELGSSITVREVSGDPRRFLVIEADEIMGLGGHVVAHGKNLRGAPVAVGEVWSMPKDREKRLSLFIDVMLENEGSRTAFVRVDGAPYGRLGNWGAATLPSETGVDVTPGSRVALRIFPGVSLDEWTRRGRKLEPIRAEFEVTAWVEPGGSIQRWAGSAVAEYFDPDAGNDSSARIVASSPPEIKVVPLPRGYPGSRRWWHRWRLRGGRRHDPQ